MSVLLQRRLFLGGAAVVLGARYASAQSAAPAGPFTLPPLPYAPDANEPHIDAMTMTIHHGRHHAAFITNLNNLLKDHPQVVALGVPGMLAKLPELPDSIRTAVRNNSGGHANHTMFWQIMGGKGGAPTGDVAMAIDRDFGSFDQLKESFNRAGLTQFGSGWVHVTVDKTGKLSLSARPNQDSPLMDGTRVLFGNDVWEHASYLKYQNRRGDYLGAWWNVVNWAEIAKRYAAAKAGTLDI